MCCSLSQSQQEGYTARNEEYNAKVREGKTSEDEGDRRILLGADAEALFPSLDATKVANIVNEEFVASGLQVDRVD